MVDPVGPAAANNGDVIRALSRVRQPVRNPRSSLAKLPPATSGCQQGRPRFSHRRNHFTKTFRHGLASQLIQERLWIKQVEMTGPALHEQKNDAFRRRRKMTRAARFAGFPLFCLQPSEACRFAENSGRGSGKESSPCAGQDLSSIRVLRSCLHDCFAQRRQTSSPLRLSGNRVPAEPGVPAAPNDSDCAELFDERSHEIT